MESKINFPSFSPLNTSSHIPQCRCNKSRSGSKLHPSSETLRESCRKGQKWLKLVRLPQDPASSYLKLLNLSSNEPINTQLDLDISRTYSQVEYFSNGPGRQTMIRLIRSFCIYNPSLGYVQGMNYIIASLLWHTTEIDAFWLFVILIEDYELRDNFIPSFPGLKKHSHIIDFLINHHIPQLYAHFLNLNISIDLFATDWFLTLFTNTMPIQYSGEIFKYFFTQGWAFFYKLCIEIIIRLSDKLLSANTFAQVLSYIKPHDNSLKHWKSFVTTLEKGRDKGDWKKIIKSASFLDINERFLHCLSHNASNFILTSDD